VRHIHLIASCSIHWTRSLVGSVTCHVSDKYCHSSSSMSHSLTYSTGTTDSGIMSEPSVDQQIDHCLIQIQTYASVITHTLRRTEYSTS